VSDFTFSWNDKAATLSRQSTFGLFFGLWLAVDAEKGGDPWSKLPDFFSPCHLTFRINKKMFERGMEDEAKMV
jgi:hypothetical protein